ncbi:MAG: sigma-54-dependent Fis family transcriptional regulator [Neisseriaceae bacterium]|nr:MAG: sigma-54-dependent Fis family transcriptional regulator [Neisseriaceae bacterium]
MNTPFASDDTQPALLLVDDDPLITDTLQFVLRKQFAVSVADSCDHAMALLRQRDTMPDLALIDLGLPPSPNKPDEGFRLIGELLAMAPGIKIVVLSGQNDDLNARHARALGAVDFVAKPCEPQTILQHLLRACQALQAEARSSVPAQADLALVGQSLPIQRLRSQIRQFAPAPFPVLIEGESGTGKELVARAIHAASPLAEQPYLVFNCAAIAPTLVESTLFGHARGAFTGASNARAGYFEDAGNGTLFLDEIGELPLEMQSKLLRVLENGDFQRVGETQIRYSKARVVAATNRDLREEARNGRFRADLYHRLSVFSIGMPALRELGDDRLLLLDHFARQYQAQLGARPFSLDASAQAAWMAYPFPGNIRELRNIVIRLTTKYPGQTLTAAEIREEFDVGVLAESHGAGQVDDPIAAAMQELQFAANFNLDQMLKTWEGRYIEAALRLSRGNVSQAAKLLGINRTTLYGRLGPDFKQ